MNSLLGSLAKKNAPDCQLAKAKRPPPTTRQSFASYSIKACAVGKNVKRRINIKSMEIKITG